MNLMSRKGLVLGAALLAVMGSSALAGPWSSPNGSSDNFSYANGGDINGRFGDPFVTADTFFFTAANFHVQSAEGGSDTQGDVVSFDVTADAGLQFSLIRVTAFGSYAATGPGTNSVDLDANLDLTENGGLARTFSGSMITTPGFPQTNDNGGWTGVAVVDMQFEFPVPHDSLHVELSNDLLAISGPGGSAEINQQFQDLRIELILVPEPASLSLIAAGAFALLRRRR